jgi:hypothetical protein
LAADAADYSGKIQAPLHLLDLLQAQVDQAHIPDHFSVTPCFYRRQFVVTVPGSCDSLNDRENTQSETCTET